MHRRRTQPSCYSHPIGVGSGQLMLASKCCTRANSVCHAFHTKTSFRLRSMAGPRTRSFTQSVTPLDLGPRVRTQAGTGGGPAHQYTGQAQLLLLLETWDLRISSKIHKLYLGPLGDLLVAFPALIAGYMSVPVLLLGLALSGELALLCTGTLGTLGVLLTTDRMKTWTHRLRPAPYVLSKRLLNLRSLERTHALPSGDSAQAALWATLIYCRLKQACAGGAEDAARDVLHPVAQASALHAARIFLLVPAVMFGRVFYGCHWVGDTLLGSAVGFAWAAVMLVAAPFLPCAFQCAACAR